MCLSHVSKFLEFRPNFRKISTGSAQLFAKLFYNDIFLSTTSLVERPEMYSMYKPSHKTRTHNPCTFEIHDQTFQHGTRWPFCTHYISNPFSLTNFRRSGEGLQRDSPRQPDQTNSPVLSYAPK